VRLASFVARNKDRDRSRRAQGAFSDVKDLKDRCRLALILPPYPRPLSLEGTNVDRRRQQRVEQYFDCVWASEWSEERSRVSNLSPEGCYIECRSAVPSEGTSALAITVTLPTGEVTVQGTVVHSIRGVGFAVQFTAVDEDAHAKLTAL